ncbi:TOBE domain-containing protein [Halarcobacter ebronensis]|uniref:Transporter n=1 Tax=Halarcobacter ebronensis TaxID=1462615 RepID=A0A4Q1APV8_9BACT|nr:TOBE domain-containing protein [Halarcobacter ebronensis]QKF80577.1 molybdenum-pterin binding domain-containing protein [Halarcobacter ebronensis]RXK08382.1 transporter [Halarcobacter ebronensis]
MNKIVATISKIHNIENLNIVEFESEGMKLKMMSLDLKENTKVGQSVFLTVKPTHIAVAKNLSGDLSYSNQIESKVFKMDEGELLSVIYAKASEIELQSIITTDSAKRMNIKIGDKLTLLIKASDLSILEVIDD